MALLRRTCGNSSIEKMKVFCATCCTSCHPIFSGAPGCCSWSGEVSRFLTDCTSSIASASPHRASMPTIHSSCAARLGRFVLDSVLPRALCRGHLQQLEHQQHCINNINSTAKLAGMACCTAIQETLLQAFGSGSQPGPFPDFHSSWLALANARASRTGILLHFEFLPGCLKQMNHQSAVSELSECERDSSAIGSAVGLSGATRLRQGSIVILEARSSCI